MKKKVLMSASLAAVVLAGAAFVGAAVPPPPVNQFLGIYDTKFPNLTKADCLECHISDEVLVQQHHALINTVTPPASCINTTGTVPPTLATGCHVMVPDGSGGFTFQDFRNCFNCHTQTPHHTSAAAVAKDCKFCHGNFIDNPLDGHYIPTYGASSVTPLPGGRTVTSPTGSLVTVQGCEACHQAAPNAIDPKTNTVRPIFSNQDTHHGTGITDCNLCHNTSSNVPIRQCEVCHGVNSLHNIQRDSPNTANLGSINPGLEDLGWGHIGNNWDCQGCHWSWFGNSSPFTDATVPAINGQSSYTVTAGKDAVLTITGASFVNVGPDGVTTYQPTVTLTCGTTNLSLTPFSVTESEIKVSVPALTEGVYELRVAKAKKVSNLAKLTVAPARTIAAATLAAGKTLTITGTGFGPAPSAEYDAGTGVFAGTTEATVISWSDTKVVATSPAFAANGYVTVKTIGGALSGKILAAPKKVKR